MDENKKISSAVIRRLPRYYRYLGELLENNVTRISSKELSERMKVTASQIRQDLNNFGGFGQQGYGYNVEFLYNEIAKILGIDKQHRMVIVGAGNFGSAVAKYDDFAKRGFVITSMFDKDPEKIGKTICGVKIRPMEELKDYIKMNNIDIAALMIPTEYAIDTAQILVDAGIKGIWNFAHTDLSVPEDVIVENVHLSESLMRLSYNLKNYGN
jgi:redox-sensing transcriptional repressor